MHKNVGNAFWCSSLGAGSTLVTFTVFDLLFLEMQSLSQTQSGKYGSFGEDLLCAGQSYWVHREVKVAKIHLGCIRCAGKSVLLTPVMLKIYF